MTDMLEDFVSAIINHEEFEERMAELMIENINNEEDSIEDQQEQLVNTLYEEFMTPKEDELKFGEEDFSDLLQSEFTLQVMKKYLRIYEAIMKKNDPVKWIEYHEEGLFDALNA